MFATLGLLATIGLGISKPVGFDNLLLYRALGRTDRARVSIWLDRTSPYTRGDRARVYVSAEQDAYLTVLRIDTDGRVRVLFPQEPWDDNYVPGGRTFEVEDRGDSRAFRVDDSPGAGYVFAIASEARFDYSAVLTPREHWDYRAIADGQVRGDPYVAVTDLAERIVPDEGEYDYDLAQYDVERHYDYPRFVCYDCHAYAPYYSWNPYAHSCVRFRVVIYDDPYYYPYRYYGGRRVVVTRPRRPQPRYVFVDNNGGRDYVTRIPNRPRRDDGVADRPGDGTSDPMRPRRGEDVGGRGTIPVPGNGGRRIVRDPQTREPEARQPEGRQDPQTRQPERRRPTDGGGLKPQPPAPESRPERRREQDPPAGLRPQARPPQEQPRTEPRREEEPRNKEPDRRPESRPEPQRPPEQRQPETRREPESRPEPRAEPRREPEQRQPETRREPERRQPSGGSSSPELRRRRG